MEACSSLALRGIVFLLLALQCRMHAAEEPSSLDQAARAKKGSFTDCEDAVRKLGKLASDGDAVALGLLSRLSTDQTLPPALREVGFQEIVKLERVQRLDNKQLMGVLKSAFEDEFYTVRSMACVSTVKFGSIDIPTKVELIASLLRRECSTPVHRRGACGTRAHFSLGPDFLIKRCLEALAALGPDAAAPLTACLAKNAPETEEPDEALCVCLALRRMPAKDVSAEKILTLASKTKSAYLTEQAIIELQAMDAKEAVPFIKAQAQNDFALLRGDYTLCYYVRGAAKKALKHFDPQGNYDDIVTEVRDSNEIQKYMKLHSPKE